MYREDYFQKGKGSDFGSSADFHSALMAAIWSPCADIAIILALYSYRKIWIWVHGGFFLFAIIYTLSTSIPILQYTGIIPANSTTNYKYPASTLNLHYVFGIACLVCMSFTALLGITTRLLNIFQIRSQILLISKKIHGFLGYIILLLCKLNISFITSNSGANGLIIAEIILMTILVVVRKLIFPKMEAK